MEKTSFLGSFRSYIIGSPCLLSLSACVLHNVCLVNDDYYECCMDDEDNDDHPVDEPHCSDERAEQKRT